MRHVQSRAAETAQQLENRLEEDQIRHSNPGTQKPLSNVRPGLRKIKLEMSNPGLQKPLSTVCAFLSKRQKLTNDQTANCSLLMYKCRGCEIKISLLRACVLRAILCHIVQVTKSFATSSGCGSSLRFHRSI
ncbi:hypothetical protein CBL_04853 [Carabus blaptoides fortunei]